MDVVHHYSAVRKPHESLIRILTRRYHTVDIARRVHLAVEILPRRFELLVVAGHHRHVVHARRRHTNLFGQSPFDQSAHDLLRRARRRYVRQYERAVRFFRVAHPAGTAGGQHWQRCCGGRFGCRVGETLQELRP